jgi:RNA polymerase sigma-70 factor, ECF subfamily
MDQALSDLCATHGRVLFRVAAGILRDRHAAEDVCQQAFLKAWQQLSGGAAPTHLKAWLTRVTVNESLRLCRHRKVELRSQANLALSRGEQTLSERNAVFRSPWLSDTPVREALLAALNHLPDLTRAVLVLRVMHGLSGNEVKELLGCSAAEVSRRLYHGMEQLRRRLSAGSATAVEVSGHES